MSLNYSYKHDISYANYNNSDLPWKINSSYIYHNNQTINSSLNLGPINNNLVIESSQNNIVLVTPQNNKQVIVNNNMTINNNLDISNILKTNFINANDLCSNGIIHTTGLTIKGSINILGRFKYRRGAIDISVGDTSASETRFRGVNFKNSMFYDSSINNSTILTSDFSNMNIFNSYIYNTPIGYDKSNNSNPAKAVFSDVLLYNLLLDTSTNAKCYIKFSNSNYNSNYNSNSNYNTPIIIKSSDDYAKLEISKPLNIGPSQINTNISNISVFNGDISCETLYYSQLFPDVKLNNYFDISIGQVSVSGNVIPSVNNRFNIGSTNLKFNEIYSANFFGFLDGSCSLANDLIKNLDMSFNNLDIGGTITLNKQNLAQFLSGDLKTIASSISDFSNANRSLLDLSISLYSKSDFDLCLNTNITKRSLLESSFSRLTNDVTNISNSVYSKSDFDLCLNRNLLRINDLSAIVSVVSSPSEIYPRLSYLNSSLVKVNSAKVSDELVFPYAITYIDDNVEDTNIKESYLIKETTNKATTTITTKDTVIYTRTWKTTATTTNETLDIQPDNASHPYVTMQSIRDNTGVSYRRKWYDVPSNATAYTVFRKITTAHTKTEYDPPTTRYEVDGEYLTWQQHRNNNTSSRTLAIITTAAEHELVRSAIAAHNPNVAYFIGATSTRSWLGTGGTITTDNNYVYHTFTSVGTHTFTHTSSVTIDYLVVGGGGSGGAGVGGGGGGGGVITGTSALSAGSYTITVGAGGARAYANSAGNNGGSSSIGSLVSAGGGGGGGGWNSKSGKSGGGSGVGRGGGGGFADHIAAAEGGSARYGGGGGRGDASASGKNGAFGISSSITGTTTYYGGGGGGGANFAGVAGVADGGTYNVRNGTYGGGNGVPYNSNNANKYFWTHDGWTLDANTLLNTINFIRGNYTYTVAVNFGSNSIATTVNGVQFQAHALSGPNFSIGGTVVDYTQVTAAGGVSGAGSELAKHFIYGGNPRTVTLYNLTPGATYRTSFFSIGFDSDLSIRRQRFTGNGLASEIATGTYGQGRGIVINITFIADNTGTIEFKIEPLNTDTINGTYTFHLHALANMLISTSSTPFVQYTDAVPNTGGGGGGTDPGYGLPSGAGGSGIVIIRYPVSLATRRNNWKWYDNTNVSTSIANWSDNRPQLGLRAVMLSTGRWYDYSESDTLFAVFKNTNYIASRDVNVPASNVLVAENSGDTLRTWEGHRTWATSNSSTYITYKLVSITNINDQNAVANAAEQAGFDTIFIGAKRKAGSSASGRTSNDWEWSDGTAWSNTYNNFSDGFVRTTTTYSTSYTGGSVPTKTNRPADYRSDTPSATYFSETPISGQTNVKLPLLVSSNTGSIVATSTAVSVNSLPAVRSSYRVPANDANNIPVSGFGINDPDTFGTNGNSVITRNYSINTSTTSSTSDLYPNNTTDTFEYIRTYKYTYDTYSYVNSYYSTNNGLTTGSFKISDNSNNNSNYISPFSINNIPNTYSCIAISDDGMFVALGKANDVTVYMRNSTNGWTTIGSPISVNFTAYTGTGVGIIPTQFTENWRKNLKNLAINFNYNTGSATSQLLLAFGDTINIIKVYSYSNGNWTFPNGFYSVAGGSWGNNTLTSYSATTLGVSDTTNFGYFVTLSQSPSPSVLGFTVDDRFYTYNCTTTNNSIRGSVKTLPISFSNATRNIVAFKMSSDADKIIVSNTHYVFIYKWINTDFSNINTISYLASDITFNYGSFTKISAAPRSLDISNISSNNNDCVFAIGFPDVLIDISVNRKARGYVEYWKLTDSSLNRLATLMPRKRDFNNSSVDSDEYFFSAGGIKITNANTIIVAPNFKFHFNGTTKKYELDPRNDSWTTHNSRATSSRFLASIQNEVENELVKISARNNNVWIGGKRLTNPPIPNDGAGGKTSRNWEWITPDPWNYQNFASGQPNALSDTGLEFSGNGWNDLGLSNTRQAIFFNTTTNYSSKNTFSIFNNFFFHSSGFSSTYFPTDISTTVMARWYSRDTSLNPTNTNTIHFTAGGRIVSLTRKILTLSDIRLKENIVDTTPKLEDLLKVRVVNYSLKGSNGAKLIGVVAQELEQLFPSLVNNGELSPRDIILGKTESYKSVKYSCFDVILIKAFQEQMAIINKLSLQLYELECKINSLKTISQDHIVLKQELDFLNSENELFKININIITNLMAK